ncbi:prepilin-type N-terminal cleavage/methylation domain-containing protein [Siccirubricoccus deserti]
MTRRVTLRGKGFTLVEVLAALVVLGLVVGGLAQGMRFGLQAWDRAASLIEAGDTLDAVDRTLRHLVARMHPGAVGKPPPSPPARRASASSACCRGCRRAAWRRGWSWMHSTGWCCAGGPTPTPRAPGPSPSPKPSCCGALPGWSLPTGTRMPAGPPIGRPVCCRR